MLVGLFGIGAINAPLYIYISRWFDRRRGSALALMSSGGYLAGSVWPPIFERMIAAVGWRNTMLLYSVVVVALVVPLAMSSSGRRLIRQCMERLPEDADAPTTVLGWPPNAVFAMMCAAIFLCCTTMSIPQGHLVALCSDLGISASRGAAMLSLLLGTAVISRQVWGLIADRIGALRTIMIGSAAQATAMTAFMLTQNEVGLFSVSAAFGLGFSGLIPGQYPCRARAVSRVAGVLAHSGSAVMQRHRHGNGRVAGWRDLRSFRLLCAGIRDRRLSQSDEFLHHQHAGVAPDYRVGARMKGPPCRPARSLNGADATTRAQKTP